MSTGSQLMTKQVARRPHLAKVTGEVGDLRRDIEEELLPMAAMTVEEFVDPVAADVNAIKTSLQSEATEQTYLVADLDGVVGAAEMVPPRNPSITTTSNADIDAVVVVVTGKVRDHTGKLVDQVGAITLTDAGNTTDLEDAGKVFSTIESYVVPAQSGTGGALEFGFGDVIGLAKPIKSRAGLASLIHEVEAGAVVTTGTIVDAATASPHGTYEANNVPDASRDYAITYEYDPTVLP